MKTQFETMVDTVVAMYNSASEHEQKFFRGMEESSLVDLHSSLGLTIRNHFNLWDSVWVPEIVDGVDISPDHPDAVSLAVIVEAWQRIQ